MTRPRTPSPAARATSAGAGSTSLAPLLAHWKALAPRERMGLGLAAAVLGVFLTWSIAVGPALATLRTAPPQRATMERDLARMQALAKEAQELRALPVVTPEQASTALHSATERLGSGAKLTVTGEQVQVTLSGVGSPALLAWLTEVRSAARARVVDMQIQRQGETYQGSVMLSLSTPG